jgi:hypothetical protein
MGILVAEIGLAIGDVDGLQHEEAAATMLYVMRWR